MTTMLLKKIDNYYKGWKKWIKKLVIINIGIFFITTLSILYFKISYYTSYFERNLIKDKKLIELDFNKLHNNYERQLRFVKDHIEKYNKELDTNKLNIFFDSAKTLIVDKSIVSTILVIDKNYNIKYSNKDYYPLGMNLKEKSRNYAKEVLANPNKIVCGEIVKGILSGQPSLPLVVGLVNPGNKFNGAVFFTINLENLSSRLVGNTLHTLKIEDYKTNGLSSSEKNYNFSRLGFFIFDILLTNTQFYKFEIPYKPSNKTLVLSYNLQPLRNQFWLETSYLIGIVSLLFIIFPLFIYFYILKPLKETIPAIGEYLPNTILVKDNFLEFIPQLILYQHNQLKEKGKYFSELLGVSGIMVKSYNSKANILVEDIEEFLEFPSPSSLTHIENVQSVHSAISIYKQEIEFTSNLFLEALNLIKGQNKKPLNVMQLIIEHKELFSLDGNDVAQKIILSPEQPSLFLLFEDLFIKLIQEIFLYNGNTLLSINFHSSNTLSFTFYNEEEDLILNHDRFFSSCKIWALFNSIKVEQFYKNNKKVWYLLFS